MRFTFRLFAAAAFLCAASFLGCIRPAVATTQLCPAEAEDFAPIGAGMGTPAPGYSYQLTAVAAQSVDASLVADTNHGWFAWTASSGLLEKSQSKPLAVIFPAPLVLNHAWIVHVKVNDLAKSADSDCDVPAFPNASITEPTVLRGKQMPTPSPLPSPESTPAVAKPAAAPFQIPICADPFEPAYVTEAVQPAFPQSARDLGLGTVDSYVEIVLDENGKLLDARTYRSAGWAPLDLAALQAARHSSYAAAISYCRPVKSVYLFRAQFKSR